jgi:DNA-binding CsgD family transcriptional regulator/Tfp pilus assembly protein PilF
VQGIVGRGQELAALASFLARARRSLAVLVIEGEPGIGKTALWQEGVRLAGEDQATVLVARATESETALSFVGLADLLDPLESRTLDQVPGPQRSALLTALLRTPAPGPGIDERALSASVLTVLRVLSRQRPVVVAVDDAPWLDSASSRALTFTIRRLGPERVGFLCTARTEGGPLPSFDRAAPATTRTRLSLGPLSLAALHELIKRHTGHSFPRPVLVRIAEASQGNPFYSLEIAAELLRHPGEDGRLPVPPSLSELLEARFGGLPEPTLEALVRCAMLSRPTPELVDVEALEAAERAGIVVIEGGRIRFSHPLLAAAVYQRMGASERRRVHRHLAEILSDSEERARHLALGSAGPDPSVATELDAAASLAGSRGAPVPAAELVEMAIRLTPSTSGDELAGRQLAAARHWFDAGDLSRAQSLVEQLLVQVPSGQVRYWALALVAQIHFRRSSFTDAMRVASQAHQETTDPDLRIRLQLDLAFLSVNLGDFAGAERHARSALRAMPSDGDRGLLADVLAVVTMAEFLGGKGLDDDRLRQALELEEPTQVRAWQMRPTFVAACLYLFTGRPREAAGILVAMHTQAVERGEEGPIPLHCFYLVWALIWNGELERAGATAEVSRQAAELIGDPMAHGTALNASALVHAHDGTTGPAMEEASEAIEIFQELNWSMGSIFPTWALGLAHAAAGRPDAVDAVLGPLAALVVTIGDIDPVLAMFLPEEIEALIELDRLEQAEDLLRWLEDRGRKLNRPLTLAVSGRCRALLLAARGDQDAALSAVQRAVADHDRVGMPIERARTLLVWGRLLRRTGRRAQAKEVLGEALRVFDRTGARPWCERAQVEVDRLGGRRGAPDHLTPTESVVAALAASGISNRQIADQAFLTVKAVEANLTRVYRKLGIRSRGGLARALDRHPESPTPEGAPEA